MKFRTTRALVRHWHDARGKKAVPNRSELWPSQIASVLPETFILGPDGNDQISFRLAGTQICALFDRELSHMPFQLLWTRAQMLSVMAVVRNVVEKRLPLLLTVLAAADASRPIIMEMVLLPLLDTEGDSWRVLGALTTEPSALRHLNGPLKSLRIEAIEPLFDVPPMEPGLREASMTAVVRRIFDAARQGIFPNPTP